MKKLTVEIEDEAYEVLIRLAGKQMWNTGKEITASELVSSLINYETRKRRETIEEGTDSHDRSESTDRDKDKTSSASTQGEHEGEKIV